MLDRFDEAGIVFWSETLGPGVSLANTQDPVFMKFQLQQLAQMLDNAMNHAAIMTCERAQDLGLLLPCRRRRRRRRPRGMLASR